MVTSKHHNWPAEDKHLWSKWEPANKFEQYRMCLHPECNAVQTKTAPNVKKKA